MFEFGVLIELDCEFDRRMKLDMVVVVLLVSFVVFFLKLVFLFIFLCLCGSKVVVGIELSD